jgi:hypothetical protein
MGVKSLKERAKLEKAQLAAQQSKAAEEQTALANSHHH